ncbi:hypothetical protein AD15_2800 [Escherichia coli 3-105-05_S4_C2]|nr:hypothetical protein AD15_2800 [Escherichia coli 3-105-05_S4_C2]
MQNKKIFLILQGKNLVENVGYVPWIKCCIKLDNKNGIS